MKIAVLGATGRTGRPLVEELLRRGHELSVLVRDPAKLGELPAGVTVVTGDSRDREALGRLVAGADAVVSALGPVEKDPTLHRDTAPGLLAAMTAAGVDRFVGVSGAGIDVPGDQKSPRDKAISWLIQRIGGAVVADKPAEYAVWAGSGVTWTLVRPPRLQDGTATGRIEHDAHRSPKRTTMSRGDLAVFLADVVEQGLYPWQAPLVARGG
ncbi:MAG TPA: NAD(P)H-binding protein [Dermatophilaceae bacterium]|nr:NAD(P)H-binding protein [Dermatophilaceae bacterium]